MIAYRTAPLPLRARPISSPALCHLALSSLDSCNVQPSKSCRTSCDPVSSDASYRVCRDPTRPPPSRDARVSTGARPYSHLYATVLLLWVGRQSSHVCHTRRRSQHRRHERVLPRIFALWHWAGNRHRSTCSLRSPDLELGILSGERSNPLHRNATESNDSIKVLRCLRTDRCLLRLQLAAVPTAVPASFFLILADLLRAHETHLAVRCERLETRGPR